MGTRSLLAILVKHCKSIKTQEDFLNQFKLWQYNQWDGYPEGIGVQIYEFLKKLVAENQMDTFVEYVNNVTTYRVDQNPPCVANTSDEKWSIIFDVQKDANKIFEVRGLGYNPVDLTDERVVAVYDEIIKASQPPLPPAPAHKPKEEKEEEEKEREDDDDDYEEKVNAANFWKSGPEYIADLDSVRLLSVCCGANILPILMQKKGLIETKFTDLSWACSRLSCEYGYIIDCEKRKLHVLAPFTSDPLDDDDILHPLLELTNDKPLDTVCVFDIYDLPATKQEFLDVIKEKLEAKPKNDENEELDNYLYKLGIKLIRKSE